ncbi:hypothetical protein I4U23_013183 [Adineta vaga]|nr:hypothetical protein I4U23_013183 [Adineta vaga]
MSYFFILSIFLHVQLVSSKCTPSVKQCGCQSQQPNISSLTSSRIVGGSSARPHSWPWIVSIRQSNSFNDPGTMICAGSLINEKYVLTAAHCFYEINHLLLSNYFIVIGAHYINDTNSKRFQIQSIKIHENYDHNLFSYDIALIELSQKVNMKNSTVGSICLPPTASASYPSEKINSIAIGWGRLNENSSLSYRLQQVRLPIISNKNYICSQQISDNLVHLCAGFIQGKKDTCQGDSGGPLMIFDGKTSTWHIAGITSYGSGCAQADYPGVYTRI